MPQIVPDPKVTIEDVLMVRIIGLVGDQSVISHMNMVLVGAPGAISNQTLSQLKVAFRTNFRADVIPNLSDTYRVVRYEFRILDGLPLKAVPPPPPGATRRPFYSGFDWLVGDPTLDKGAIAGDQLPAFNSVLVHQPTGLPGKGNNGNLRLGPVLESQQVNGFLNLGGLGTWELVAEFYSAQITLTTAGVNDRFKPGALLLTRALRTVADPAFPADFLFPFGEPQVDPQVRSQITRRGPVKPGR